MDGLTGLANRDRTCWRTGPGFAGASISKGVASADHRARHPARRFRRDFRTAGSAGTEEVLRRTADRMLAVPIRPGDLAARLVEHRYAVCPRPGAGHLAKHGGRAVGWPNGCNRPLPNRSASMPALRLCHRLGGLLPGPPCAAPRMRNSMLEAAEIAMDEARRAGRLDSRLSPRRWAMRVEPAPGLDRARSGMPPWRRGRSAPGSSRRSPPIPGWSPASRRWRAGTTPSAACCRPATFMDSGGACRHDRPAGGGRAVPQPLGAAKLWDRSGYRCRGSG